MRGLRYKDIQEKYNITDSQLISLIQKYKWKRKSNRSKVQKKNQNAKGNKGGRAPKGNKNAVTTGEYENIFDGCFSDDEKTIFEKTNLDKKAELIFELNTLKIRESRILRRMEEVKKRQKDMTISFIRNVKGDENETITDAEPTNNLLQRIEDGLTRVQEAKRRCLDSLHKMEIEDRKFEIELIRLERDIAKEEMNDSENVQDDSFIKALDDSVESAWDDYDEE